MTLRLPGRGAIALAGLLPYLASAETGDAQTPPEQTVLAAACPPTIITGIREPPRREGLPTYLWAQEFDAIKGGIGEASGNVELLRGDQRVASEHITWDMEAQSVVIPGEVSYRDAQLWLDADRGDYDIDDETGSFTGVNYGLVETSAHGSASEMTLIGGTTSYLNAIDFTTCPGDQPVWVLSAEELELQHDEGQGVARNAKLKFGKVPVLWVPWFTFPIDGRRKSGFLYPSIGKADDTGYELAVPWYWNIAPNQDATIVPRWFTDRGFMLTGEYRLLTQRSAGQVNFDYMPNDDVTDESRYQVAARHEAAISRRWHSEVIVNRVSDDEYFQDFGSNLEQTSRQYLPTRASIDGGGRYWTFVAMADDFQVIDRAVGPLDEPYRRLPRFLFTLDRPLGRSGLLFSLDSEVVYFDRDVGVEGGRSDFLGQLTWGLFTGMGLCAAERWVSLDRVRPGPPHRGTGRQSLPRRGRVQFRFRPVLRPHQLRRQHANAGAAALLPLRAFRRSGRPARLRHGHPDLWL